MAPSFTNFEIAAALAGAGFVLAHCGSSTGPEHAFGAGAAASVPPSFAGVVAGGGCVAGGGLWIGPPSEGLQAAAAPTNETRMPATKLVFMAKLLTNGTTCARKSDARVRK